MGYGRHDPSDYASYTSTKVGSKPTAAVFTSRSVPDELDPKNFTVRESRDSTANPTSNAIIIACDVTGSMGMLADKLVRGAIGTTFEEMLERAKANDGTMVTDPQVCAMAIGDVRYDNGPVQATQFETEGKVLSEQLQKVFLEGGGGGNSSESYDAAWYFAARRTSTDCYEKRNKKGYLFTLGDEEAPYGLTKEHIQEFFGDEEASDLSAEQLLAMAEQKWNVFHIMVMEGSHASGRPDAVKNSWSKLLGQRAIPLYDWTKLAEVIVSTIQVTEGADKTKVVDSWSGDTSLAVKKALDGLTPSTAGTSSGDLEKF